MKKRLVPILVALALVLLVVLVACDNQNTPTDTSDTSSSTDTTDTSAVIDANKISIISADGSTEYQLVRAEEAEGEIVTAISEFYRTLGAKYGIPSLGFKYTTDWLKPGETPPDKEILVGKTNREETQQVLEGLQEFDYAIVMVGTKLVICGGSDEATLQAISYFIENIMTDNSLEIPENFSYICSSPPRVVSYSPENTYYYENVYTPTLVINYVCSPAIDMTMSKLVINGKDYTSTAVWADNRVTLSGTTFEAGDYEVILTLYDTNGNSYKHTQYFSCGDGSVMNLYKGEVHAHTKESDGQGTVEEAYAYARDIAKLDFFAITDHSNSINLNTYKNTHKPIADKFNDPGKYVTLYGYEQTYNISTGYYGHLNVLNTLTFTTRSSVNLPAFYRLMAKDPDAIVMFNHPGYTWGNFLDFKYDKDVDKVLNLIEIKGSGYDTQYALALTQGWHVSPVYNEDNHSPNWGNASEACGYVLAPALTRANIIEAFEKNRTYTTTDGTLKIYYKINNEWMGARLDNPDKLEVSVNISTERPTGIGTIYLMTEANIIVAQTSAGTKKTYDWNLTVSPDFDYYYIKVVNSSYWAVTAPIWIENRDLINITDMTQSLLVNNSGNDDYGVKVTVKNSSSKTMTDVTVSFYKSSLNGFNINSTPFATVKLGNLSAGSSSSAEAFTSYSLTSNRITAIVTGKIDGKTYGDTSYTLLSQLYMTEVLPAMSQYNGVSTPFCYIELYNNSDTVLDLSSYKLRYYSKAGANATDLANNTWNLSGTIQPHSTVVIWFRTSTKLTVADFNAKFGTNLVEGDNILVLNNVPILPTDINKSVQLELVSGSTVVNRICYNWGDSIKSGIKTDKAITFDYNHMYVQTSVTTSSEATPTPGSISAGQVPTAVIK